MQCISTDDPRLRKKRMERLRVLPLMFWYLQGGLTLVIAIIAVMISWRQHKTNAGKVKLDLFDRRFRVFDAVRKLIGVVLRNGGAPPEELQEFYLETLEADFLFGTDIRSYLNEIHRRADKLWTESKLVRDALRGEPSPIDRTKWAKEHPAEMKWFDDQVRVVTETFKKYLDTSRL
jgi:hypothetical protein